MYTSCSYKWLRSGYENIKTVEVTVNQISVKVHFKPSSHVRGREVIYLAELIISFFLNSQLKIRDKFDPYLTITILNT